MKNTALMVGLGEVLWDLLPQGKVLGGAPANFAYMANMLGNEGIIASRIGSDSLGSEAGEFLAELGLATDYLQLDEQHETGTAEVATDMTGQPIFNIKDYVAWDFLEWTEKWDELALCADVICFGSLAQRSSLSSQTIDHFLSRSRDGALRIFDVNLRQPFYSAEVLERSFEHANVVKLTDQELLHVAALFKFGGEDQENLARRLLREFGLQLVCLTRGARGSLLVTAKLAVEHKGILVEVADTVGAGDAFTACLAHHLVRGTSLQQISESANLLASWVATQTGAMPKMDRNQPWASSARINN